MTASLANGGVPSPSTTAPSFVDGAGSKGLLPPMWERARDLVAGAFALSLDETAAAVRLLASGRTSSPRAPARSRPPRRSSGRAGTGRIVCIVSGGNIDSDRLAILAGRMPE